MKEACENSKTQDVDPKIFEAFLWPKKSTTRPSFHSICCLHLRPFDPRSVVAVSCARTAPAMPSQVSREGPSWAEAEFSTDGDMIILSFLHS